MQNHDMSPEDRARIFSNDYADLIINYSGDENILRNFEDATIHIINYYYAIVHVPVSRITDNIILEMGYSVMPSLFGLISQSSVEASGIRRLRNIPRFNLRGQGVLVGIIDTGIDYTNSVFKYADNTTKIVSIWDQTIDSDRFPGHTFYGTEYTREQINEALKSDNPYELVPSRDTIGHGTMLAGIAVGNEDYQNNFFGIAPDAELVVVKLKQVKPYLREFFRVPQEVPCYQENDILFGLEYLWDVAIAQNRPIAICIALGTSQGAHDGRGTLSSYVSYLAETDGVAVVVAAGNEGNSRRHFFGEINPLNRYQTVELNVGENEEGFSMELWGNSPGTLTVDIQTPSGEYVPRIVPRLDENRVVSFIFEPTVIHIDYQLVESQSGDQLILFRFTNPAQGIWKFNVYGTGVENESFHIWLPMNGFISDDTFFINSNPYTTILSLGNARVPITVTAYNPEDDSLYYNASRGFTRIGVIKPEIAAPGLQITAPNLNGGFDSVTGTSPSAAHATGVAALLLEWAVVRGEQPTMSTLNLKIFMIRGARRKIEYTYPNRDWGYGILDVYNVFDSIRLGI